MKRGMITVFGLAMVITLTLQSCQDDPIVPNGTGNTIDTTWVIDSTGGNNNNPYDSTYYGGGNGGTPIDSTWNGGGSPIDSTWYGGGNGSPIDSIGN